MHPYLYGYCIVTSSLPFSYCSKQFFLQLECLAILFYTAQNCKATYITLHCTYKLIPEHYYLITTTSYYVLLPLMYSIGEVSALLQRQRTKRAMRPKKKKTRPGTCREGGGASVVCKLFWGRCGGV